jgi:hypothetical protein
MYEWLLIAISVLVASILPPIAIWWLSQRSRLAPFLRSLEGVQSQFMGLMGVLFGLNLIFVCNEIWQSRDAAVLAMSREAEALRNIGRIAANIPDHAGVTVFAAARQYIQVTIEHDFQRPTSLLLSTPRSDEASLPALITLSDVILRSKASESLDPVLNAMLVAQLTTVRDKRLDRVALLTLHPNRIKWTLLIFLEVMSLLSIALVHVTNGRALLAACLLYLLTVNPFLLTLYSSQWPFSGIYPLPPRALTAALERLSSMEAAYK